jgi:hypothetical protein
MTTKLERAHLERIGSMECVCCRLLGRKQESRTSVHHIREGREPRNHWLSLPLCKEDCHQGPQGIHGDKTYLRMLKMSEYGLLAIVIQDLTT